MKYSSVETLQKHKWKCLLHRNVSLFKYSSECAALYLCWKEKHKSYCTVSWSVHSDCAKLFLCVSELRNHPAFPDASTQSRCFRVEIVVVSFLQLVWQKKGSVWKMRTKQYYLIPLELLKNCKIISFKNLEQFLSTL